MYVQNCRDEPFIFVSMDNGMGDQAIKRGVLQKLASGGIKMKASQIIISGTHTHSGSAGFLEYFVFQITSSGFIKEAADALIDGVYESIIRLEFINTISN
jgi:neutral ceramidase